MINGSSPDKQAGMIKEIGSSTFVMGKNKSVAERHRRLARHNVPGKTLEKGCVLAGRWNDLFFKAFPSSLRDEFRLVSATGDAVSG
jgi:hypothetical protein